MSTQRTRHIRRQPRPEPRMWKVKRHQNACNTVADVHEQGTCASVHTKTKRQAHTTQHAQHSTRGGEEGGEERKGEEVERAGSRMGRGREGEVEKAWEGKVKVKCKCSWWCLHSICCQNELRVALLQNGAGFKPEPVAGLWLVITGRRAAAANEAHKVFPGPPASLKGERV